MDRFLSTYYKPRSQESSVNQCGVPPPGEGQKNSDFFFFYRSTTTHHVLTVKEETLNLARHKLIFDVTTRVGKMHRTATHPLFCLIGQRSKGVFAIL